MATVHNYTVLSDKSALNPTSSVLGIKVFKRHKAKITVLLYLKIVWAVCKKQERSFFCFELVVNVGYTPRYFGE
jgi:hypothetical protein